MSDSEALGDVGGTDGAVSSTGQTEKPDPIKVRVPKAPPPPSHDDTVRKKITFTLLGILAGVLLATVVAAGWLLAFDRDDLDKITLISTALISPIVGLVGSVIGYYFGQQNADSTGVSG